jgi:glycosyltransferase involved in cell wall biosynthesis
MYNLADLQIQQSWGEGFCMPLAEGFATGLPAIGVNHSAIPEVIGDRGELMEPSAFSYNPDGGRYHLVKPEVIAEKIEEMFSKPKKLKEYGKRGRKWVSQFTPKNQAEQMLSAFERVIKDDINCLSIEEYVNGPKG